MAVHYHRSADEAGEVEDALLARGVRACRLQADLSSTEATEGLVDRAWDWSGGLDLLVNNASIFPERTLLELTLEDLVRNMTVNAWAPLVLTRTLWRRAEASGRTASVVNLTDSRLEGGDPYHAGYFLSKVALDALTRMTAREMAPVLRVNAVAPGPILPPEGAGAAYLRQPGDALPLGRPGSPFHVARTVVYLASSPFVTGQTVFVDGGQHLRPWAP